MRRMGRIRQVSIIHTDFGVRKTLTLIIAVGFWVSLENVWSWPIHVSPTYLALRRAPHPRQMLTLFDHTTCENPNFDSESTTAATPGYPKNNITSVHTVRPLCYYRSPLNNRWKQRIDIENLSIGQELQGIIVQEKLTNTTTGPKLWLDVGVCRWSNKKSPRRVLSSSPTAPSKGSWSICTAMLRLGRANYIKESVIRKKVARLRGKNVITVYVSRIRLEQGQFEVVLTPEEIPPSSKLQSISQLQVGDEVTGTVARVEDYGVLIKMDGYNRHGLLHIQRVADLYRSFIDKQSGLMEAGLDLQSRLKLQVLQKDRKRVFLDFTDDVKRIAAEEFEQEEKETEYQQNQLREQLKKNREASMTVPLENNQLSSLSDTSTKATTASSTFSLSTVGIEADDLYDNHDEEEEEYGDPDDEAYDSYDEERDIEDALGLGTY